ncbi:efflux RND transporter permease subunit [Babesia caballi]|uniref:Efflux RND transporter permease subunit n=1 Tax=Babesia caballi TaxID=5871 RepID=A0AAV4LXM3_BABCB|nr:efflux RND transporter permease subunit [Babesia caballi]
MALFADSGGLGLDARGSPVLSPSNWLREGRRDAARDRLGTSEYPWELSRRRIGDGLGSRAEPAQLLSSRVDTVARSADALFSMTPEGRALQSRILDSPGNAASPDLPFYLRSVESRKASNTPKRSTLFARGATSPRRSGYALDDPGYSYKSPLLSGRSRLSRRSRATMPDLRIGTYTPRSQEALSVNAPLRSERYYDALEPQRSPPNRHRINIHATDDILNRIKRNLSECENISKRLDKQYGTGRAQRPAGDYSERVFPRALADNLFSSRAGSAATERSRPLVGRVGGAPAGDGGLGKRDAPEAEKPKSTLSRIIENIKRIRNRALFSDGDDVGGKRTYVEVEKEELGSPQLSRRPRTLDVDAIQQRIKQQKRSLLSQRTSTRFD